MKIWLSGNLLSQINSTGIAACFGIRYDATRKQTLIEGSEDEITDLQDLLSALLAELRQREQSLGKRGRTPSLGLERKAALVRQIAAISHAVRILGNGRAEALAMER